MLTNEDKFWIKEQLDKILKRSPRSSSGVTSPISSSTSLVPRDYRVPTNYDSSKKEVTSGDPELDRHYALAKKIRKNQETLAERLEYERLTLKLKLDVGRKIKNQVGKVTKNVSNAFEERFGTEGWKDTRKVIGTTASSIGGAVGSLASGVGGAAGSLASGVGGALGQVGSGLSTGARQLAGTLRTDRVMNDAFRVMMYSNPVTAMLMEFSPLLKGAGGAAKSILSGTGKAAGSILKGVGGTFKSIGGGIGGAFKSLGGGIGDLASYFYGKNKNKDIKTSKKGIFGEENDILEEKQRIENQNVLGGTNYILAQKAIFIGGKNNVIISTDGLSGMFKMKQDLDNKEEIPLLTTSKKENQEQKISTNNYSEIKKDYIDAEVISSTVIKEQVKQEKTNTEKLSKGLDGIKEEVEKSNKFLDMLNKKNLLILLAVGAAIAAVAAVAANFPQILNTIKSLSQKVSKFLGKTKEEFAQIDANSDDKLKQATTIPNLYQSDSSSLRPEFNEKRLDVLYNKVSTKQTAVKDLDWKRNKVGIRTPDTKGIDKLQQEGILPKGAAEALKTQRYRNVGLGGVNQSHVKQFSATAKGLKFSVPVTCQVVVVIPEANGTGTIVIERSFTPEEYQKGIPAKIQKIALQARPQLVITGVLEILVPHHKVISPKTPIAILDQTYTITGDESAFSLQDNSNYQNQMQNNKELMDNYHKTMGDKTVRSKLNRTLYNQQAKAAQEQANSEYGSSKMPIRKLGAAGKAAWETLMGEESPSVTTTDVSSTNVDKAKENAQEITQQQKEQTNNQITPPTNPPPPQKPDKLSMLGGSSGSQHYAPTIDRDLISPYDIIPT